MRVLAGQGHRLTERPANHAPDTLPLEQRDATADEHRCQPAPAIDVLVQHPLRRNCIADESERTSRWSNQAYVRVAQRKEEREEAQRHAGGSSQEAALAYHRPDRTFQA